MNKKKKPREGGREEQDSDTEKERKNERKEENRIIQTGMRFREKKGCECLHLLWFHLHLDVFLLEAGEGVVGVHVHTVTPTGQAMHSEKPAERKKTEGERSTKRELPEERQRASSLCHASATVQKWNPFV